MPSFAGHAKLTTMAFAAIAFALLSVPPRASLAEPVSPSYTEPQKVTEDDPRWRFVTRQGRSWGVRLETDDFDQIQSILGPSPRVTSGEEGDRVVYVCYIYSSADGQQEIKFVAGALGQWKWPTNVVISPVSSEDTKRCGRWAKKKRPSTIDGLYIGLSKKNVVAIVPGINCREADECVLMLAHDEYDPKCVANGGTACERWYDGAEIRLTFEHGRAARIEIGVWTER